MKRATMVDWVAEAHKERERELRALRAALRAARVAASGAFTGDATRAAYCTSTLRRALSRLAASTPVCQARAALKEHP